jgi:hypothetical protein
MIGRRTARSRAIRLVLASVLIVAAGAACSDDDEASAEELRAVEDIVRQTIESDASNADFFFAHTTDRLIEAVLFSSRDECRAMVDVCLGDPLAVQSLSDTAIDGDQASTVATTVLGDFDVGLILTDDVWKIDSFAASSDEIPDGTTVVDLSLADFAFIFEQDEIPSDGNVAFRATNDGSQAHEVVVIGVPAGSSFEEALAAVGAEEVAPLATKIFIAPGQQVDLAFDSPLPAGDYAFACFFPDVDDPAFAPHFEKGMFAEFSVD